MPIRQMEPYAMTSMPVQNPIRVTPHPASPSSVSDLKRLISSRQVVMPPQAEKVARLAFEQPEVIAFGTLKSVATLTSVSVKTVMRMVYLFGFTSFRDFRLLFRRHLLAAGSQF
jgi:DNA-binding MurR/RpiR family transcriptional regulator